MRKKIASFIFALVMLSIAVIPLVGCVKREAPEQPYEKIPYDTKGKIVVTILSNQAEIDMFTAAITEFNKIYANIEVELYELDSYEGNIMGVVQNEDIDVIHVPDNMTSFFADQGILYDLDDYIEASGFDTSLYYESMIRLGKFNYTGAQYMMPRDYSRMVTYWNKGMFDQYGITKRPTADWTWDDFIEICGLLYEKIPATYKAVDVSFDYAILNYAMLASYGVENFLDSDYLIDNTAARRDAVYSAMSLARDAIDSGYALKPNDHSPGDFHRKVAAMSFEVRPAFSTYASKSQAIDFEVAPFPAINGTDNAKIPAGTSGFSIFKNSFNKNIAWAFIEFIMSERGQLCLSKVGNVVPVLKSLAEADDAEWRKVKNGAGKDINHDAFVMYPERDVCNEYFGTLPPAAFASWKGAWNTMCKSYYDGGDFDLAYDKLVANIKATKTSRPDWF